MIKSKTTEEDSPLKDSTTLNDPISSALALVEGPFLGTDSIQERIAHPFISRIKTKWATSYIKISEKRITSILSINFT